MPSKPRRVPAAPGQPDWHLKAWMKKLGVSQAQLAEACGWSRGTMNGIYHGRTAYYRELLNFLASKLEIAPYELLMPPERALAYRDIRKNAEQVVESSEAIDRTGTGG